MLLKPCTHCLGIQPWYVPVWTLRQTRATTVASPEEMAYDRTYTVLCVKFAEKLHTCTTFDGNPLQTCEYRINSVRITYE